MARMYLKPPEDPSLKKNYKPKSIIYRRFLFLSVAINLILLGIILLNNFKVKG